MLVWVLVDVLVGVTVGVLVGVFVKVLVLSWPGRGGRQSRVLPIPWWAIGLDGSGPFCGIFTDLIGEYCRPGPYLAIWYPDF